jgi:hypothetical protein
MPDLYAKFTHTDRVVTFGLLLHKPAEPEYLLADEFGLGPKPWPFVARAFASIADANGAVCGYTYDPELTGGMVALSTTREGLAELLADLD